jgi:hypothetical protein
LIAAAVALLFSAAAGAPSFDVWPGRDNPDLDRPGSPGVTRIGSTLRFDGQVPWVGRHTSPRRQGHRVSFGDAPPNEAPEPKTWEHYTTTGVLLHGENKGTESLDPIEFERKARLGYFVITLVQNLLIATVFFFVVTMLLRVKRVSVGALHVLARCLVPAAVVSGLLLLIPSPTVSAAAFLLLLGMNALLFVLWERPAAEPEPFEV